LDFGKGLSANQAWHHLPGGRTVQICWLRGGRYPGMPFDQQMSFPTELALRRIGGQVRLCKHPIAEIESLYVDRRSVKGRALAEGQQVRLDLPTQNYDLSLDLELADDSVLTVTVLGQAITVEPKRVTAIGTRGELLEPVSHLRVLADITSIEIFANHGEITMSYCVIGPDKPAGVSIKAMKGATKLTAVMSEVCSIWEPVIPRGPYVGDRDKTIAKAMTALKAAVPKAKASRSRPAYHLRPPANWMNDINGSYLQDGTYHIMYQHNPYADTWGNMHFGHATSPDLVHWQHQPIAVWPSLELGEKHTYSGGAIVRTDGKPMVFYTSIGHAYREEWAAISHDKGVTWERYPRVVRNRHPDGRRFSAQDPFLFRHRGRCYLLSTSFKGKNRAGGLHLYEAIDETLLYWRYRGRFCQAGGPCPSIARIGGKWVLLFHGRSYRIGTIHWKNAKFVEEKKGALIHGNAKGTNLIAAKDRTLLFAWITRRKDYDKTGRGWAGCCSLPTGLSLAPDNTLYMRPAPELAALREGKPIRFERTLSDRADELELEGDTLGLKVDLKPTTAKSCGIRVRHAKDGAGGVPLGYADGKLTIAGTGEQDTVIRARPDKDGLISLHLYLDRAILEAFVNDGQHYAIKYMHNDPNDREVSVFSKGGSASIHVTAWNMKRNVQGTDSSGPSGRRSRASMADQGRRGPI
jgi:beta-fructofuranosidase